MALALVDLAKGVMVTADLGDSYAFLGVQQEFGQVDVIKLSHEHSLEDEAERQRIEEAGGEVIQDGEELRVGKSRRIHYQVSALKD